MGSRLVIRRRDEGIDKPRTDTRPDDGRHAEWQDALPVVQVRVARPTDRLDDVVRLYRDGLGLRVIGSFEGHAGYSGVMLGLPDHSNHLEFT